MACLQSLFETIQNACYVSRGDATITEQFLYKHHSTAAKTPPLCFSRISLNEGLQWEKYERLCICVCVLFYSDKNWVVFRKVARQDSPSTLNMCHLESLLIILKYPLSDNLLNSLVKLRQWWPIELLKQTAPLFIFYQVHL